MNWKLKSAIQRTCAMLPVGQQEIYYLLQRTFGSLRRPADPTPMWEEAVSVIADLNAAGFDMRNARVLEVGTGRRLDMPIAFFLCGTHSVITVDLHLYLNETLAMQSIQALRLNREKFRAMFQRVVETTEFDRRWEALTQVTSLSTLFKTASIDYHAPADAAQTNLPSGSIDLHTSYTVFEHIPREVLVRILREANRLLSKRGVACHHIDPSDHFSAEDPSITAINFLQFSEQEWAHYAGNGFAYHNRLRADQYRELYGESGQNVLQWKEVVDARSLRAIGSGFPLHPDFQTKTPETLSIRVVRAISQSQR